MTATRIDGLKCPICGSSASTIQSNGGDWTPVSCRRCGTYVLSGTALAILPGILGKHEKAAARLSHAIRRRAEQRGWVDVNSDNLKALSQEKLPNINKQMLNLLHWLSNRAGDDYLAPIEIDNPDYLTGVVGAFNGERVDAVLEDGIARGYINYVPDNCYAMTSMGERVIGDEYEKEVNLKIEIRRGMTPSLVFLGHGHSSVWRKLRDFLEKDLDLQCEEFNRESSVGIPVATHLEAMLAKSAFAFLIMTAEDETKDGKWIARLNVIHEIGLFQGKLGFRKATILIEEGCEEFSNIHGLGQIRFPKGDVLAKRDEIKKVLEREGLLKTITLRDGRTIRVD